jgi:hypothetical protein
MPQPRSIPQAIRSGYNATGSAIGARLIVKKSPTVDDGILLPAAPTDAVFGVTRELVPAGSYGNVQTEGMAICTAGAAVTKGDRLEPTVAGKVILRTTGSQVGIANRSAVLNEEFEVELTGPGVLS